MFGTIGQVSAPASTVRVREIKTFGWAVGAEIKTGRPEIKTGPKSNRRDPGGEPHRTPGDPLGNPA
jgi:hypothetical protein